MAISIDRFTKKTHHVVKKVTKVWFQINAEIFRFWKISKIFDFWNLNWAYLKWKKKYSNKIDSVEMPNDEHQAGFQKNAWPIILGQVSKYC